MYMKLNNTGKNMWLWAQTLNQNLKGNAQAQDADGWQAFFCVMYDIFRGHISTLVLLTGGGAASPHPAKFLLRLWQSDMQLFKTKTL